MQRASVSREPETVNAVDGPVSSAAGRLGFWSAVCSAGFAIMYSVAEIAHQLGMLGPYDNPVSLIVRMVPSLLLPIVFVVLIIAVRVLAPKQFRIWADIAVAFAVIYAVLVSLVYFVELAVVIPRTMQGGADEVALLIFGAGTFMFAIDILGYAFMSLSTLAAAMIFSGRGLECWIHRALLVNGLLAPAIALQVFYPVLFFATAVWVVSFPAAALMLAIWFRRSRGLINGLA
jgi:hypothetical protein